MSTADDIFPSHGCPDPEVSVIIPTYKPGGYLTECLDSLRVQTPVAGGMEVVVVLNGCDRPWRDMIEEYAAAHPGFPLRLIHSGRGGVSHARNLGIEAARGRYLVFVDDDDALSPGALSAMRRSLDGHPRGTVAAADTMAWQEDTGAEIEDYFGHHRYLTVARNSPCDVWVGRKCLNSVATLMIPREVVGTARFDERFRIGEDSLFMFNISARINRMVGAAPAAVYRRRVRPGSLTSVPFGLRAGIARALRLNMAYTRVWLRDPLAYDTRLFVNRLAAVWKSSLLFQWRSLGNGRSET